MQVSLPARLLEFPGQSFRDSFGNIYCGCCVRVVPNLKESIKKHIDTLKHTEKLIKLNAKTTEDLDLMNSLAEYFVRHPDEKLASLAPNQHIFRVRVVQASMGAGIGIAKVRMLRNLLERTGNTTGDSSDLSTFIPKVEGMELDVLSGDVSGQYINSIFDSTPRLGDLLNNVLRWVTEDFVIVHRLALLITYAKHLAGVQTASVLTTLYLTRLQLRIPQLLGHKKACRPSYHVCVIGSDEQRVTDTSSE